MKKWYIALLVLAFVGVATCCVVQIKDAAQMLKEILLEGGYPASLWRLYILEFIFYLILLCSSMALTLLLVFAETKFANIAKYKIIFFCAFVAMNILSYCITRFLRVLPITVTGRYKNSLVDFLIGHSALALFSSPLLIFTIIKELKKIKAMKGGTAQTVDEYEQHLAVAAEYKAAKAAEREQTKRAARRAKLEAQKAAIEKKLKD